MRHVLATFSPPSCAILRVKSDLEACRAQVDVTVVSNSSIGREGFLVSHFKGTGRETMSATATVSKYLFKRRWVSVSVLAVGLLVGVLVLSSPLASLLSDIVVADTVDSIQRGIDADAARYTALAAQLTSEAASVERGVDASTARYAALGVHFAAENEGIQRGIDASSARYTALAESIQRGIDASSARYTALAADYIDDLERGVEADAARYTALAAHFVSKNEAIQRGIDADAARYTALAQYYSAVAENRGGVESSSQ
jgi:hypothetical protein